MTPDGEVRKLLGSLTGYFALHPGLRAKEFLRQINEWFIRFPAAKAALRGDIQQDRVEALCGRANSAEGRSSGVPLPTTSHPCSICGECPCRTVSACRSQARWEAEGPDADEFAEADWHENEMLNAECYQAPPRE